MTESMAIRQAKALYKESQIASQCLSSEQIAALARKYLPVVRSEVARIKSRVPRHVEADDLHGVAIAGMMRAFERGTGFEDERFGAYVRQRIRGAILDELRKMDVFSRTVRKKARGYDEALQKIEQREGRIATEEEIRLELGCSPAEFHQLLEDLRPVSFLSLDSTPGGNRENNAMSDTLEDLNAETITGTVEGHEMIDLLQDRLKALPQMQQKILHMYYFKDFCLAEIAEVFELSESRICQLHTHAIRGLRAYLEKAMES
jgi:RNA polymerase sigma factor for flagellar operon FliA